MNSKIVDLFLEVLLTLFDVGVGQLIEILLASISSGVSEIRVSISSDPSGKLDIFLHDCDSFGMDTAKICIFENSSHVSLCSFLKGEKTLSLESQVGVDVAADVSDKSLEWSSWQEKIS